MGTAFNPGLVVKREEIIRKTRRLPIKGDILVEKGEAVEPSKVVARAYLPGELHTIKVNDILSIEPFEVKETIKVKEKDEVKKGDMIAEVKVLFGLFTSKCHAPFDGVVEFFSDVTGHLGLRKHPTPIEVNAYLKGKVVDIMPNESVTIETAGSMIQGIFGVGGENHGTIKILANSPDDVVTVEKLSDDVKDKILVCGRVVNSEFLINASGKGAKGVIVGGIVDYDLSRYLGYDIGVAVTGHENIPMTVILTEGFGEIPMAKRTFDLLSSLSGELASINGATQIRAGALRPEIIVPSEGVFKEKKKGSAFDSHKLEVGTLIRLIRVPYFGMLGKVTSLPDEPVQIETGSKVRVLKAELSSGEVVVVPRANVEIIETEV